MPCTRCLRCRMLRQHHSIVPWNIHSQLPMGHLPAHPQHEKFRGDHKRDFFALSPSTRKQIPCAPSNRNSVSKRLANRFQIYIVVLSLSAICHPTCDNLAWSVDASKPLGLWSWVRSSLESNVPALNSARMPSPVNSSMGAS